MSVLATDSFTRANENPLAGNWTKGTSEADFNLSSNTVVPEDTNQDASSFYNAVVCPNDQYAQAKLTVTSTLGDGSGPGLCVRHAAGAKTYYRLVADHGATNNIQLNSFVAGSFNLIWARAQAWTSGDTFRLEAQGTTLRVFINGVQVGADATDSSIASGSFGLAYSSLAVLPSIDDFEGGDFGSGTSLTPSAGALTLTGQTPTRAVSGATTLSPAAAALVLTGQTPTPYIGRFIAPAAGSLAFTGNFIAPTFQGADIGQLVITGLAPTVGISYVFGIPAKALVFTGQAPTFSTSSNPAILMPAGALSLTGQVPTLLTPLALLPTAGSLSFTGQAPTRYTASSTTARGQRRRGRGRGR